MLIFSFNTFHTVCIGSPAGLHTGYLLSIKSSFCIHGVPAYTYNCCFTIKNMSAIFKYWKTLITLISKTFFWGGRARIHKQKTSRNKLQTHKQLKRNVNVVLIEQPQIFRVSIKSYVMRQTSYPHLNSSCKPPTCTSQYFFLVHFSFQSVQFSCVFVWHRQNPISIQCSLKLVWYFGQDVSV